MKMRFILLVTIFSLIAFRSHGQAEIALGIKGGVNFASLSGSSSLAAAYDNRSGYHFGVYGMFKFTKIAIQPEILFSQQGSNLTFSTQNLGSSFSYISVPVVVKLYLLLGLNLQAGVQLSFLTDSNGSLYNTSTGQITTNQSMSSIVHSNDFSIPVGIGWDLPFGLNFTFRYNIGISDVNKQSGSTVPPTVVSAMGTSEAHNQVFQVSAGYRLFKFGN